MLDVWKKQFSLNKLSLQHETPATFVRSQWQTTTGASFYYLVYRWMVTLFFLVTWLLSVIDIDHLHEDATVRLKWMIYLTNWGYTMCTLQAVLCTTMLSICFISARKKGDKEDNYGILDNKALKLYKIYWATNIIATDIAFGITVLYWSIIYDGSKVEVDAMNVLVHGTNSVLMFIELIVSSHPVRWVHFYWPIFFGLLYVFFSGIYYVAGGTAKNDKTAIYPILDWAKPGPTIGVCFGVMFFLVILHEVSYGVYKLRKKTFQKLREKKEFNVTKSPVAAPHVNPAFEGDNQSNQVV